MAQLAQRLRSESHAVGDRAPSRAPCWARGPLGILALPVPLPFPPSLAHMCMRSLSKKKKKYSKRIWKYAFITNKVAFPTEVFFPSYTYAHADTHYGRTELHFSQTRVLLQRKWARVQKTIREQTNLYFEHEKSLNRDSLLRQINEDFVIKNPCHLQVLSILFITSDFYLAFLQFVSN